MYEIGPYRFTQGDLDRTLLHADDLFRLLPGGAAPGADWPAAAHRRAALAAVADHRADDPGRALTEWWHHWRAAMAVLRTHGAFQPPVTGRVAHLFRGTGGVPKLPEDRVDVDHRGVVGDRQAVRKHHGRPWQALCLWSVEVIDALAAQGHPVAPGAAGENITVAGLDWARMAPGSQVRIGTVRAEVSAFATPCRTIAHCFVDREFDVIHQRRGPVARAYATVLEPGVIEVGDAVVIEPDPAPTDA